jgi:DNA-directed RNA polymerase sigma subunit (sigma70/sigma32)
VSERREPQFGLGDAVKSLRQGKNVSRAELARRSGFSDRWLRDVEEGRSNPTWGNVRKLAAALQVPLDELARESMRLVVPHLKTEASDSFYFFEDELRFLEPRQEQVLKSRVGFDDGKPRSLSQTAAEIGISRERVRQIQQTALARCRNVREARKRG